MPDERDEVLELVFSGARVHVTRREMQGMLRHRSLFMLAAIGWAVAVLMGPRGYLEGTEPFLWVMVWVAQAATFVLLMPVVTGLHVRVSRLLGLKRIYVHAILVVIAFVMVGSTVIYAGLAGIDALDRKQMAEILAFHFLLFLPGEILYSFLMLRSVLHELRADAAESAVAERRVVLDTQGPSVTSSGEVPRPTLPAEIQLFGQPFRPGDILRIEADEHYVSIVTPSRTHLLRGRMSDAEAALPSGMGLRIHRSHWVSRHAALRLDRKDQRLALLTSDGARLPVARGRKAEVEEMLTWPSPT